MTIAGSGLVCAELAGVCPFGPICCGRDTGRVEEHGHLTRRGHLARCHEGELVLEVLRVLDQPHDPEGLLVVALGPGIADLQPKVGCQRRREGGLARRRRVVTGEEREHGPAEGAVWVLRSQLIVAH